MEESTEQVVVDNVLSFELRYMKEGEWVEEWSEEALPEAVEISVEIESEDGRTRRRFVTMVDILSWKAAESSS